MSLFNAVASWFLKKRMYQIEMFMKHPEETQMEVFHRLVLTAEDTVWGKEHGFNDQMTIRSFQERVPVSTYESIYPYINRILEGEESVLWPGETRWFSKSSGTTNDKSKFIPVSRESLDDCHFKGGKDMLAIYLHNHPESRLFTGKGLPVGGSHEINKLNQNSYYGDLSAVLIQNTPLIFNLFRATSKKVALMGEWESKIQTMAEQLIQTDVTSIAGVPTWTLVLINKMFEITGNANRNLLDIWPNLEVFFHGGVSFKPYRQQFREVIPGDNMVYFETYNASEGFFALQNESDKEDMLLMLDYGIFYEFIPIDELHKDHPRSCTIGEVEVGEIYAMLITTNGGLWRYLIGDTIRFTSVNPYKIVIAGRTKHFINAFGEELMMENAENALETACLETGAVIADYTAGPLFFEESNQGAHEWLIEFEKMPSDLKRFADVLDTCLKQLNSDYEAKRYESMVLQAPIVRQLPRGTFYEWMRQRNKLGGQNKVPRLSNNREYLDPILSIASAQA